MSHRRCTPVVVSSEMPRTSASISGYFSCISSVRSPPSSRIMFGVQPSGPRTVCSMHHQNSSSLMPFQANTGMPAAATPRRRGPGSRRCCRTTSAPWRRAPVSVSISTAVWIVMCRQPAMRAPFSGLDCAVFLADRHQAGHLVLGHGDFLAAPLGQGDVLDLEVLGRRRRPCGAPAWVAALYKDICMFGNPRSRPACRTVRVPLDRPVTVSPRTIPGGSAMGVRNVALVLCLTPAWMLTGHAARAA